MGRQFYTVIIYLLCIQNRPLQIILGYIDQLIVLQSMEHLNRQKKQENASEEHQEPMVSLQLLGQDSAGHLQDNIMNHRDKKAPSASVNNFIKKTYAILQQKRFQNIVSWAQTSDPTFQIKSLKNASKLEQENTDKDVVAPSSFKIHNLRAFEEIVLPQYFKHSNMSSFVRQLNMYNFHKVRGDKNQIQFQHQKFKKNRPQLLVQIRRKQVESSVSISSIALIPHEVQMEFQKEEKEQPRDHQKGTLQILLQHFQSPEKKESSPAKGSGDQQQSNKLKQLLQLNKSLKKQKQIKSSQLKQLMSETKITMGTKFNKTLFALIATKIQQDIGVVKQQAVSQGENSFDNIHLMIDHIMDTSQPLYFDRLCSQTKKLFTSEVNELKKEE